MDEGDNDLGMGNYFVKYGLLKQNSLPQSANAVIDVLPSLDDDSSLLPSSLVEKIWGECTDAAHNQNLRGGIFEYLLAAVFLREKLLPFYTQAQVQYVPNVNFDFLFWTEEVGPVVVSAKTSLRERYKQADLEGLALSSVHRRSRTYLVTLEKREAAVVKAKINSGDVQALTDVILADTSEFDELINILKEFTLIPAPIVSAIAKGIQASMPYQSNDFIVDLN